jgi:hypothetical protein
MAGSLGTNGKRIKAMGPRSTFSSAADRLNRLVLEIKQQQYDAAGQRFRPLPLNGEITRLNVLKGAPSPEIDRTEASFAPLTTFHIPWQDKAKPPKKGFREHLQPPETQPAEGAGPSGAIGAVLGKGRGRSGLFNRLFRRDN